jgi:hypothetical protein
MLELGESPKTVQIMLGHSKIATTLDVYSHVSLDLEERAAARLNAILRGDSDLRVEANHTWVAVKHIAKG